MSAYLKSLILIVLFILSFNVQLHSQEVKGVVKTLDESGKEELLPSASIFWKEKNIYIYADNNGKFRFDRGGAKKVSLTASFVGCVKDSVVLFELDNFAEFCLRQESVMSEVRIVGKRGSNYISKVGGVKTEVISASGLCKMACCNLAESFENSASVTVGYADAVTGARQIRLLGLSGIYTQMLDENRPVMRGIISPFGLGYIPGQWLESIQIAKGPSSVVNGLEAITGQINMEHRKPTAEQPLFLNLFLSDKLRNEVNVASSLQFANRWSTVILGHYSSDPVYHDGNHDGFADEPKTLQFNVANRWLYMGENGLQVRFGVKALRDDRFGGSLSFLKDPSHKISVIDNIWGSEVKVKSVNGYAKIGIPLTQDNTHSIALVADYAHNRLNSFFGIKEYNAVQNSVFGNLLYQIDKGENRLVFGLSGQHDNFSESLMDGNLLDVGRKEGVIGIFGEGTLKFGEKFSLVTALRADWNTLYGWAIAPRMNVKYALLDDHLIIRASGGRGLRSPNIVADNIGMLSTGRKIVVDKDLEREDAWTFGMNAVGYVWSDKNASISLEYFRSVFKRQLVADQEYDSDIVYLYNLNGLSYTNTYQADFSIEPFERFSVIATARYTDAKMTLKGSGLVERPLISRYKGVLNLQYATPMNIWTFDFTAQINGPARIPEFAGGGNSPVFSLFFAQITRKFKGLDLYLGAENIGNYKQSHPIISADAPYSKDFNSSAVWGPLMGRKFYVGIRVTIWK